MVEINENVWLVLRSPLFCQERWLEEGGKEGMITVIARTKEESYIDKSNHMKDLEPLEEIERV